MRRSAAALIILATILGPAMSATASDSFTLVNNSRSTRCAEEDNVFVALHGRTIERLTITAVHPRYLTPDTVDRTMPDFTDCDMSADPVHAFMPGTQTLFENDAIRLVGHTFATFWRPEQMPVAVADAEVRGLHLIQVFQRADRRWIEFLVLYPADGYWRAKPLPPTDREDTAYGSSFLVGPVIDDGRPMVKIRRVAFDPDRRSFTLSFVDGGEATLVVVAVDRDRTELHVAFSPPVASDQPFAALRSMYVDDAVADVAHVTWWDDAGRQREMSILDLGREAATQVMFGRRNPSRHNTSAPDLIVAPFRPLDSPSDQP